MQRLGEVAETGALAFALWRREGAGHLVRREPRLRATGSSDRRVSHSRKYFLLAMIIWPLIELAASTRVVVAWACKKGRPRDDRSMSEFLTAQSENGVAETGDLSGLRAQMKSSGRSTGPPEPRPGGIGSYDRGACRSRENFPVAIIVRPACRWRLHRSCRCSDS